MRSKIIFAIVVMYFIASGMRTLATPYAVYCKDDLSFHFLDSDKELTENGTLDSNNQTITKVWEVEYSDANGRPGWETDAVYGEFSNVTKVIFEESFKNIFPTCCNFWFSNFESLTEIEGLEFLNTTNVKGMESMFNLCRSISSIDLSNFVTENVTNMRMMFSNCEELVSVDLSKFNTSKVTTMSSMFADCWSLSALDISNFDTSLVTDMRGMFSYCESLTSLDLSNFNTENLIYMGGMFADCTGLTSLELSNFNTNNVTYMNNMFSGCTGLTSLDLTNLNTENVTNMSGMFSGCTGLSILELETFNTDNVTDMSEMFKGCTGIQSINMYGWHMDKVTTMKSMFQDCISLRSLNANNSSYSKVLTDASYMFCNCKSIVGILADHFITFGVENMSNMFEDCINLEQVSYLRFSEALTNTTKMFKGCNNLYSVSTEGDTPNLTNMSKMFDGCSSLRGVKFDRDFNSFAKFDNLITQSTMIYVPEGTQVPEGRVNVVVGDKCQHLVINYGDIPNNQLHWVTYHSLTHFTANKVTINRAFTKDIPYTLYLPFAMDAKQYGTFYSGGELNEDGNIVTFSKINDEQTMTATPYMFKPNQDYPDGISFEGEVDVTYLLGTIGDGLQGVGSKMVFSAYEAAQKIYYGWAGGEFRWAEEGATVDACRAYFKLPDSAAAKATARMKVKFGEDDSTGITEIDCDRTGINSPLYNLNGQRVVNSYKGIVIKNGTKGIILSH